MSNIGSTISTTVLHFNNAPVSFEVIVENCSNDYASFRLNLIAAGADSHIGGSWYSLDPISSTLIPPGDSTKFSVTIVRAPILGIDLINLEVKVSSPELPDINFHNLKLHITAGMERLQLYLPVNYFAIYPRKILDIPIRVSNPNHHQVDIILRLTGLDDRWLPRDGERRLIVGAGKEGEIKFTCQPPIVKQTPCGIYPFVVKAYVNNEEWGSATGKIEILPIGTVFFAVTPESQVFPRKNPWLPQFKPQPALYQLELKNASNVIQSQITIAVENSQCNCQVIPTLGTVKPGETLNFKLEARKKRHWWGWKRKYSLKIIPSLKDLRLNTTDPTNKNVELQVHPLLPLWLQLGLSTIAIALILFLFSLMSKGHSDRVNSVTFSSDINPILSGSEDGTVRKWKATPDHLFCQWFNWQQFCLQHQHILFPSNQNSNLDRVNVVRLRSDNNLSGDFAFVGFDSGKVSEFKILTTKAREKIILKGKNLENSHNSAFNRILSLTPSPDFKTLYLGRGTKLAQLTLQDQKIRNLTDLGSSIYVLTLTPDRKSIIAGGQYNKSSRYNKIFLVDLNGNGKQELDLHPLLNEKNDQITGLKITENNLLISTDNLGLINIWDLNQCQGKKCELLYQQKEDAAINAIALTKDESDKYYLAAGDTDGNIKIWSFIDDVDSVELKWESTIKYPQQITSIDSIYQQVKDRQRLLILTGSQDSQVRLNIHEISQ